MTAAGMVAEQGLALVAELGQGASDAAARSTEVSASPHASLHVLVRGSAHHDASPPSTSNVHDGRRAA
jgi:hypothetical protein